MLEPWSASQTLEFEFGPVEILVIAVEGDPFDAALWELVRAQVEGAFITLVDVAVIQRDSDGTVSVIEVEDRDDSLVGAVELSATGLLSDDDLLRLVTDVPKGGSAIVVAVEHSWARAMADRLHELGGAVLASERISAPIVNELADMLRTHQTTGDD